MNLPRSLTGRWLIAPALRPRIRTPLAPPSPSDRRGYATHNSLPRKSVTVTTDDGRVNWGDLTAREKVARSTQQSLNFLVIVTGVLMTGAVAWYLYVDVFSPNSKTSHFNRSVERIKRNDKCIELLGDARQLVAYGEDTWNKWARNRPIASRLETDRTGTEHLYMNYNIEGPLNVGRVSIHMTKRPNQSEFEYRYFFVDVKGHERIWLENADQKKDKRSGKIFGIRFW